MSRATNGGWDFVKVGGTYQYKEDGWVAMVKILEDNSTDKEYHFKLQTEEATDEPPTEDGEQEGVFSISHVKDMGGMMYSGMLQLYEQAEYKCNYVWQRTEK